ncbi:hypothetical protein YC2023_124289 [Brassica napus]
MYYVKNLKLAYKINGVKKYKAFVKSYEKEIKSTVDIKQTSQLATGIAPDLVVLLFYGLAIERVRIESRNSPAVFFASLA